MNAAAMLALRNAESAPVAGMPLLPLSDFRASVLDAVSSGMRISALFGVPEARLDADDAHLDDRAQRPGQRRAEIACKAVVDRRQCPDVVLAHPLGALEIVSLEIGPYRRHARAGCASRLLLGRRGDFAAHRSQQRINLALVEDFAHAQAIGTGYRRR